MHASATPTLCIHQARRRPQDQHSSILTCNCPPSGSQACHTEAFANLARPSRLLHLCLARLVLLPLRWAHALQLLLRSDKGHGPSSVRRFAAVPNNTTQPIFSIPSCSFRMRFPALLCGRWLYAFWQAGDAQRTCMLTTQPGSKMCHHSPHHTCSSFFLAARRSSSFSARSSSVSAFSLAGASARAFSALLCAPHRMN